MSESNPIGGIRMSYFKGLRVDDQIYVVGFGNVFVDHVAPHGSIDVYPIHIRDIGWYTLEGIRRGEKHPSAFWSDPHIVAPPRPKRMVKKIIEGWVNIYDKNIRKI